MVKKLISRKKFLTTSLTGIAGIGIINRLSGASEKVNANPRKAGRSDILVSSVCFGAPRTNEESLLRYAIGKGISFIDTGRSYSNGNNERLVGRAIQGIRKEVVIQSKIRLESDELPSGGKGRKGAEEIKNVLSAKLEESLKALNTDYIDILLYHDALDEKLLFHDETLKFFADLKQTGVIRASGFSAHNDYLNLSERNNKELIFDMIMVPFNHKGSFVHSVSGRYSEWDQERLIGILEEAHKSGIGVVAMKTCSGGKYSPSPWIEPNFMEAVKWVLQKNYISAAAIAMASFEQVDEHLPLLVI